MIRREIPFGHGTVFRCVRQGDEAKGGFDLPGWMFDPVVCSQLRTESKPVLSLAALLTLKNLLREAARPKGKDVLSTRHSLIRGDADAKDTVTGEANQDAVTVRRLAGGRVLCGFAGSAADAFALLERFEKKLSEFPDNTRRAVTELAKEWRTDRVLRRLEAMLAVADVTTSLIVSGAGDVIEPTDGIIGIGSGGSYAAAAAKALLIHSQLSAREIVEEALKIAAELCIYTNAHIKVETLP